MYLAMSPRQRRFAPNPPGGLRTESHQADRVSPCTGRSPATRKHQMITPLPKLAPRTVRDKMIFLVTRGRRELADEVRAVHRADPGGQVVAARGGEAAHRVPPPALGERHRGVALRDVYDAARVPGREPVQGRVD